MAHGLGKGLYRSDLLTCIKDRDQFWQVIDRRIFDEAHRYGCRTRCEKSRLLTAHDFFVEDCIRVRDHRMPEETEDLDYFKFGACVGFWLRRLVPVNEIAFNLNWADQQAFQAGDLSVLSPEQKFFARYGNEIAAFRIAFEIVHYCAVSLAAENARQSVLALLQSTVLVPSERTVREIAVTLKHKNNSPHSLYITLLALFDQMDGG